MTDLEIEQAVGTALRDLAGIPHPCSLEDTDWFVRRCIEAAKILSFPVTHTMIRDWAAGFLSEPTSRPYQVAKPEVGLIVTQVPDLPEEPHATASPAEEFDF
jgi:hypothetical protein